MSSNTISDADISFETAPSANVKYEEVYSKRPVSYNRRLRRIFWHFVARQFTLICVIVVKVAGLLSRRRRELLPGQGCEIMLTGRFDSDNWILAHLGPLSASKECARVWMVSTNPVPEIPKVVAIYPPKWLMKMVGVTPSRLLTFLWAATRKQPHIVGGFHIMVNGIGAAIIGRFIGARSIYFCVGGPAEISDGGIHSADSYFRKMETVDTVVEKRLIKIVSNFNEIITMGTRAVDYFRHKGINTNLYVVSGGIDSQRFKPTENAPLYDLILTGRLVEVKRIDVFLIAIKNVAEKIPDIRAVVVGDGNLNNNLKRFVGDLGIKKNVSFLGYQDNIENWLRQSKIFVLTSDSEGLSLSMMEAMMCGLPAVVSDVGDLGDLVEHGVNGFLVPRRCTKQFAARIIELLTDEKKLNSFSKAARNSALKYSTQAATEKWNHIIKSFRSE